MRKYHRRTTEGQVVPKALVEEIARFNEGLTKGNVLTALLTKDVSGRKVGFNQAKRGKGVVALGPTTLTPGTYSRYQRLANKLGISMATVWRVSLHAMLPVFEKAAEKMPAKPEEAGCPHCGK